MFSGILNNNLTEFCVSVFNLGLYVCLAFLVKLLILYMGKDSLG